MGKGVFLWELKTNTLLWNRVGLTLNGGDGILVYTIQELNSW